MARSKKNPETATPVELLAIEAKKMLSAYLTEPLPARGEATKNLLDEYRKVYAKAQLEKWGV